MVPGVEFPAREVCFQSEVRQHDSSGIPGRCFKDRELWHAVGTKTY